MSYTLPYTIHKAVKDGIETPQEKESLVESIEITVQDFQAQTKKSIKQDIDQSTKTLKLEIEKDLEEKLVTNRVFQSEINSIHKEIKAVRTEIQLEVRNLEHKIESAKKENQLWLKVLAVMITIGFTILNPAFLEVVGRFL